MHLTATAFLTVACYFLFQGSLEPSPWISVPSGVLFFPFSIATLMNCGLVFSRHVAVLNAYGLQMSNEYTGKKSPLLWWSDVDKTEIRGDSLCFFSKEGKKVLDVSAGDVDMPLEELKSLARSMKWKAKERRINELQKIGITDDD